MGHKYNYDELRGHPRIPTLRKLIFTGDSFSSWQHEQPNNPSAIIPCSGAVSPPILPKFPNLLTAIMSLMCLYLLSQLILTVGFGNSAEQHEGTVALRTLRRNYVEVQQRSSFKIALFADLHFGEDAWTNWGPRQDVKSIKVMSTVLDQENPGELSK